MGEHKKYSEKLFENKMIGLAAELKKRAAFPIKQAANTNLAYFNQMSACQTHKINQKGAFKALLGRLNFDGVAEQLFMPTGITAAQNGAQPALSMEFNADAYAAAMLEAYVRDLPRRMGFERYVDEIMRKIYALRKNARRSLTL